MSCAPRAETEELISGSEAIAHAVRLADVDVITAYPIRPYDTVMQYVSKMIADGDFDCDFIVAESEHSQFEIVKHASAVGARVFAGSSGVGWFYAFEALAVTAGLRLPMVAMVGNRALDDPGAFGVEHNDALAVRDLGWMLSWVSTAQEALDTALIAYRVAEDQRVFLPCAISCDGAFLTHSQSIVKVPSQAMVDEFLPRYDRGDKVLHPDNPITIAPQVNEDWLMEMRRQTDQAMRRSREVLIEEAYRDFNRTFGRGGEPFIEALHDGRRRGRPGRHGHAVDAGARWRCASCASRAEGRLRAHAVVPSVRLRGAAGGAGRRAGGRRHRPRLLAAARRSRAACSPTSCASALYPAKNRPKILSFIAGLGGREVSTGNVMRNGRDRSSKPRRAPALTCRTPIWIGARE